MKIAMIGHKRIPSREGGIEVVVENLASRMVELGHEVVAYNRSGYHVAGKEFDNTKYKVYKGIRIKTIPTFKSAKLNAIVYSFGATIASLFKPFDVYHFHAEGPCFFLWINRLFKRKARLIVTVHGLDWQRAKWGNFASKILLAGERQAVKYADDIIVLSKNVQDYFRETYGRETIYIPNGIVAPESREAQAITEKWGLESRRYILFLARLVPEKGLHYLIEAYKRIDTDVKLVIAGGNSHSTEYVQTIEAMAQDDSRILFTHFVQGQKLEELYSNAYAFVLPSDIEGMAMSLLEAMSYGNCCLVSDIPENVEVVGEYALTFKAGDVDDLERKLRELLQNPDVVERYRSEAGAYILDKHNWDGIVSQTLELYK